MTKASDIKAGDFLFSKEGMKQVDSVTFKGNDVQVVAHTDFNRPVLEVMKENDIVRIYAQRTSYTFIEMLGFIFLMLLETGLMLVGGITIVEYFLK